MKNIILYFFLTSSGIFAQQYKYCELVGIQKILGVNLIISIDSGQLDKNIFKRDSRIKESSSMAQPQTKNEKFYVTTDQSIYEGKQVQSDSKGKFIWKQIVIESTIVDSKTKSFTSMTEGLNYMGAKGWEFVQAYVVTIGKQNIYRWILKKKIG